MENNTLYNKYRPIKFSEIVGHSRVISELQKRAKDNIFAHTMMFSGNTGLGKTTLQRIVAKTILCGNKDVNGESCNICDICKTIDNEKINNFYMEINASNLNIEEVRSLVESTYRKNLSSIKRKVYVIDEFQEMKKSPAALKSLLKPLENEINNVFFILGTMSEQDIPPALKNRCVHYKLKDLTFEEISKCLYNICLKEEIKIDTTDKANTLITIAQNSDGSMRTAISYLERCIYSDLWQPNIVLTELGILSNDNLGTLINKLLTGDVSIFEQEITKEILEKIRWALNLVYKKKEGVELNSYQKSYISTIANVSSETLSSIIDKLNKLTFFPYITQELIDFTLIDILKSNKNVLPKKEEVRRERVKSI